jgi:hypothetical protein
MDTNQKENQTILQTLALISQALSSNPFGNKKLSIIINLSPTEYSHIVREVENFTRISSPQQDENKFSVEIDELTFIFSKEIS